MKNMNRNILVLLLLLFMATAPVHAQIFIQDSEYEGTSRTEYEEYDLISPIQGTTLDQYLPLGNGLLLLAGLGGAYLLKKRKGEKKH